MKKIVLIGDSIRMGYDKYVKAALENTAEVYYPEENCRFAQYVLRYVHDWKNKGGWPEDTELVHWNAGLWDVAELFGDAPLSTVEHYADTVARIDKRLRMLFPNAKFVFALSTSIVESGYSADFRRHNATIEEYNAAAIKALEGTGTVINDLYAVTKDIPSECRSDVTHFNTDAGRERLGGAVLSVICRELDIKAAEVNIEGFEPEKYTAENIGY